MKTGSRCTWLMKILFSANIFGIDYQFTGSMVFIQKVPTSIEKKKTCVIVENQIQWNRIEHLNESWWQINSLVYSDQRRYLNL